MREHAGQADALRDVVAVVDGVEVAGGAGVADQGVAGQREGLLGDDLADLERDAGSFVAPHDERGDGGDDVGAVGIGDGRFGGDHAWPPSVLTLVTVRVAVSSSPATIGRV